MKRTMIDSLKVAAILCGFALVSTQAVPAQTATATATNSEEAVILTPKPPAIPRINGAKVFGVRPGHPFLFTIAATGDRPMTFSAKGLPKGLALDSATGHITGQKRPRLDQPRFQYFLRPGHRPDPGPGLE
jgi:hypothetical protein